MSAAAVVVGLSAAANASGQPKWHVVARLTDYAGMAHCFQPSTKLEYCNPASILSNAAIGVALLITLFLFVPIMAGTHAPCTLGSFR